NVQTNQAGQYAVVVSNGINSALSLPATLTVVIPTVTETFFSDNFDAAPAAGAWITNRSSSDTRVTFNYNYAGDFIPSAPNSAGGTTRGIKFEANLTAGVVAAISVSPANKIFTGDYDLKFDLWINANGTFPLGGTGSTEHLTAGVGTTGTKVQWGSAGTTSDGTWFAVDGEGQGGVTGTVSDFLAYVGVVQQTTNSGTYSAGTAANARNHVNSYYANAFPGQAPPVAQKNLYPNQTGSVDAGAVGFKWRDVLIRKTGNKVEWFIDGLKIAGVTNGVFNGSNIFVGYWDGFVSVSDNTAMSFGLVDNLRVERTTEAVFPAFVTQPQKQTVVQGSNATFTASATGTTSLFYQWRLNELNIPEATNNIFSVMNAQPANEGLYSVVVSNIAGKISSTNADFVVLVPPSIATQPEDRTVIVGGNVEFSVEADGSAPFFYQWLFNGNPVPGATDSTLSVASAQTTNAGNYSVIVTNAAGSTNSNAAGLVVETVLPPQFQSFVLNGEGYPQFVLQGTPGSSFLIQISTNLTEWETLTNAIITDQQTFEFIDVTATNAMRFYRATSPP
ncbi:MAG: immunoglobulin domain-containing protein, partial [Verrucomicrobiota bacterium]